MPLGHFCCHEIKGVECVFKAKHLEKECKNIWCLYSFSGKF